jgi:hypothetical protein
MQSIAVHGYDSFSVVSLRVLDSLTLEIHPIGELSGYATVSFMVESQDEYKSNQTVC